MKPLQQMINKELCRLFPVVLQPYNRLARLVPRGKGLVAQCIGGGRRCAQQPYRQHRRTGAFGKPTVDILLEIAQGSCTKEIEAGVKRAGHLVNRRPA